jgi:hypothetical protein
VNQAAKATEEPNVTDAAMSMNAGFWSSLKTVTFLANGLQ